MNLQEQAEALVKNLKLVETLSIFGETHLVGNVALKTTIKPDIDIQVYANRNEYEDLSHKIKTKLEGLGLTFLNRYELSQSNKYLIKAEIKVEDATWTIDVTLTEPNNDYLRDAYKFYTDFSTKLNEDNRKTIMLLKEYFLKQNKLKYSMAYYIYRAVIDENAKTPQEIIKYKEKAEK